jgi:hypothetical protein
MGIQESLAKMLGGANRYKIVYMAVAGKSRCVAESAITSLIIYNLTGRGGGIRTPDPLLPKQIRRFIEAC